MAYSTYALTFPRDILNSGKEHPLLRPLLPLETGLFEKAAGHGVFRRGLDEYILIYCTGGRGYLELNGEPALTVLPGTLFICPPGVSHRYWADPKAPWTIYWVHYIGGSASVLTEELGLSRENPRLTIGNSGKIGKQFLALADSFRRGHGFPHLYSASAILQNLFAHLIEAKNYRIPPKANHFSIEELLAYLRDNTDKDLKLDDLSGKAGISRFHLSRQFSEATGISPMAYFHQLKIRKACELLDTTGLCIKEISLSLGFRSPYYFSESFKRVMGISPTAYRKSGKA